MSADNGEQLDQIATSGVLPQLLSRLAESRSFSQSCDGLPEVFRELMSLSGEDFDDDDAQKEDDELAEHGHFFDECDPDGLENPLSGCQLVALNALVSGLTQVEAARLAGKSARWIWGELNQPGNFRNAHQQSLKAMNQQVQRQALERVATAVDSMAKIAADTKHRGCLDACRMLIELGTERRLR